MKKTLCAVLVISLFSCKKDEKKAELTKENLSATYRQTAETINGANTWNTSAHEDCDLDDLTQLKVDGTYIITDAGTVCSPSNNDDGSWSINGNTLTIDGQNFNVESFDGKTLSVKATEAFQGMTLTTTASFVKQ